MKFQVCLSLLPLVVLEVAVSYRWSFHSSCQSQLVLNGAADPSLTLYSHPRSRSKLVEWYLKEIHTPYVSYPVNLDEKEQKAEPFLKNVNPFGKVPAITSPEFPKGLSQSGAILLYLSDKFDSSSLDSPEYRAILSQWILFANSDLTIALFLPQGQNHSTLSSLNSFLSDKEYLVENKFSVADVAVGAYLLYIPRFKPEMDFSCFPHLVRYMKSLASREYYKMTNNESIASIDSYFRKIEGTANTLST